ncbi:MAG: hypothetical protein E6J78_15980 [Deltaproteobacteria bacterium]|nr:MAG: hypothetical protein E6J78_15980 [Deltaproteobacteria bacterium]
MITEFRVNLLEARETLGTIVMAAAYGNGRFVISRYGKTVAAVVGLAELEALRDLQDAEDAAPGSGDEPPLPPAPPDPIDELRKRYERGEAIPLPRDKDEREAYFRLAREIGSKIIPPPPAD